MFLPVPRQVPSARRRRKPGTAPQAARIQRRQLERSVSWTVRERLRWAWCQFRLILREIDYANYCLLDCRVPLPRADSAGLRRGRTTRRSGN